MMRNQLALSSEQIVEKVYPQLLYHVGMIRGEYLLRELNQKILLASCQQFVKELSKKLQRRTHDTARNVECIQENQSLYR